MMPIELPPRKTGPLPSAWPASIRAISRSARASLSRVSPRPPGMSRTDSVRPALDDLVDQLRHGLRRHRHHQQIETVRQVLERGDAADPVDLGGGRMDDHQPFGRKTLVQDIFQDDPAEIVAAGGDPDDADTLRVQQGMDLRHRPGGLDRSARQ